MGVYIRGMDMPKVCITEDGWHGNCPMDRIWCMQRFAPEGRTTGECYAEMQENIPTWCPLVDAPEPAIRPEERKGGK